MIAAWLRRRAALRLLRQLAYLTTGPDRSIEGCELGVKSGNDLVVEAWLWRAADAPQVADEVESYIAVPAILPPGYELVRRETSQRLNAAANVLADLDRCEHGRHLGDVCGGAAGCNGPSHGNQFLTPGFRLGTQLYGAPIVVPAAVRAGPNVPRTHLGDASLWTSPAAAPAEG